MVDVLAVGAHPDDIELRIGASLAAWGRQGHSFGLLHLTRGEMATRGTVETRREEAGRAAKALGASALEFLDLGDGQLQDGVPQRNAVIQVLRRLRPEFLLVPHVADEHPDHAAAGTLCKAAWYLAGIRKLAPGEDPAHRPGRLWFYPGHEVPTPDFISVVTKEDFERKMAAIRCYASQFHDPDSTEPATRISDPLFLEGAIARMRYFGSMVGAEFGEPLLSAGPLAIRDLPESNG